MTSQHWSRQWLGAWRHQAITWANIDPCLYHHINYLGHNELKSNCKQNNGPEIHRLWFQQLCWQVSIAETYTNHSVTQNTLANLSSSTNLLSYLSTKLFFGRRSGYSPHIYFFYHYLSHFNHIRYIYFFLYSLSRWLLWCLCSVLCEPGSLGPPHSQCRTVNLGPEADVTRSETLTSLSVWYGDSRHTARTTESSLNLNMLNHRSQ